MAQAYDRESLSSKLIELLAQIGFGRRYFEYYAEHSKRQGRGEHNVDRKTLEVILAETGLGFKYFAKEKFFRHVEKCQGYDLMLHAAFPYSAAEFLLYVKGDWGVVGGPWSELARQVMQASDPDFNPSPASPKLPFSNEAELREVVQFGITLFGEARDVITSFFDGWIQEK
ncbi:MAG TPA: hypothetical protein VFQ77_09655 [Pseudonocardiaceae bacterium]|jgi:hypothetical protein|nr:hypothetical protein [Pseudonocardiaceae bacterium]